MKFKSIKHKVLFWFIGIITVILFLFSFLLYSLLENVIHGDIKIEMENKTEFIQKNIIQDFNYDKIQLYSTLLDIEFVILKNNEIVYASDHFPLERIELYKESENRFFIQKTKHNTEDAVLSTKFTEPYKGEVILHLDEVNDLAEEMQEILLYLNPLLLLFLVWVGSNMLDKILIPIKKLTNTVQNINISEMPKTIASTQENNEITQLIHSFNEMVERLQNGIDTLNNFNYDVSHELKTPITVVNAEIELCLRKNRDREYYENSMNVIRYEVAQIKKIIDELFLFTRYSKENIQATFKESFLDSILLDVLSKYENNALEKRIHIEIKRIEHIKLQVNPLLINIIFSNLIDNAIKYTNHDKKITIELFSQNNQVCFSIEDQGIGIKKEHLKKITDKFYRVDESRNKNIQGFGLGLSIVKNFVTLHNANLDIHSTYQKGTRISINF
ncbi:MAG: HAMP domain-containing sensor histidine kinase [Arcobacteraceae bacterium]